MRVRRLLVSGLLVGLTLGVGAPIVSAAPVASTAESCDYILDRYQLTSTSYVNHQNAANQLRQQAATASGSQREELLARAAREQKLADDSLRFAEARREQLRTECGIIVQQPNIRMAYSN